MRLTPLDPWLAARMNLPALRPEEVWAWQLRELRATLAWAKAASSFHARRLADVDPAGLRGPDDLARLPRMTPADLAAPGLLAVSQDEVERVVSLHTSGSTGAPKRLLFTEADLARTLEFFVVGMATLARQGDTVLVLLPGQAEFGVADLLARALPHLGARAVRPAQGWAPADLPALIREEGVSVLVAAPAQLRTLLDQAGTCAACRASLRAVLISGEPLSLGLRVQVESVWDCEVFDHWGLTESGYGGGVECFAHSGYHLREADLLVEVADPATGRPLPPGQTGEILLTTLGPRALPLVRYRTGDAARWLLGTCPCGSSLRRLGPVQGRLDAGGANITQLAKGQARP